MVSPISIPGFPSVHTRQSAATCDAALESRLASLEACVAALPSLITAAIDQAFADSLTQFRRDMFFRGAGECISAPFASDHHGSPAIDPIQLTRSPICAEGAQSQLSPSAVQAPPLLSSSPLLQALATSAVKPHSKDSAAATVLRPESKAGIHASTMTSAPRLLHEHSLFDTTKNRPEVVLNLSIISATSEAKFPSLLTDKFGAYLKDKFGWVHWYLVGKFVKKNFCALKLFDEMSKRQNDNMFIQPLVHNIEVLHLDCLAIQLHYFDLNCYLGFEYGSTIVLGRAFACSSGFSQKPMFGAFGSNLAQPSPFESPTQTSQATFGGSIIGSSTPIGDICYCNSIWDTGGGSKFNKMQLKMAVARIKLLRNKGHVVVKQMRRVIALLLQSGKNATARIRVEHVIREQNILAANEFIELFCELVVSRLSIIAKQRECPPDLKEGIASLIFASPRCSEIPELIALRNIFEKKYGKDFVSAAVDVRPSCGVNRMLIDKLSVRTPTGEVKLKLLKEIAKEYQVEWDTSESEQELLKPPEELIQGHRNFVSATSMPVHSVQHQSVETNKPDTSSSRRTSGGGERRTSGGGERRTSSGGGDRRSSSGGERGQMHFVDSASAAEAAAKSASDAMAAAQVAAYLANKDCNQAAQSSSSINNGFRTPSGNSTGHFMPDSPPVASQNMVNNGFGTPSGNSTGFFTPDSSSVGSQNIDHQSKARGVDRSHSSRDETMDSHGHEKKFIYRRYSYNNAPSEQSDTKFDDSDCDEEVEMESPPNSFHQASERTPPPVPSAARQDSTPRVHPKLPDYDALAARFDALKNRKSS